MTKGGYLSVLKTMLSTRKLQILAAAIFAALLLVILVARNSKPSGPVIPTEPGWHHIEDVTYYIMEDGTPATGWQKIDGNTYYFRSAGSMVTGWLILNDRNYYFLKDGTAASGPVTIGNDLYIFHEDGIPATGWTLHEGRSLYLDSHGKVLTGWQTIGQILYYFGQDGLPCPGWLKENGKTYYIHQDGTTAQGRNIIDGQVHYFGPNGQEIILVNPWNYVPADYTVELTDINADHQVATLAYEDLQQMMTDCKLDGGDPVVCSGYRTQEYQEMLYNNKVKRLTATGMKKDKAQKEAATVVALPGTSEHQLGLALDIIDRHDQSLTKAQEKTATQQWLMANSWKYGWILRYPNGKSDITGIIYEPWHYRYVGREIAQEIHESGLCLEEYLDNLTSTVG